MDFSIVNRLNSKLTDFKFMFWQRSIRRIYWIYTCNRRHQISEYGEFVISL